MSTKQPKYVMVPAEIHDAALNYIRHVGSNWTMRGEPHPQQWIVDGLEAAVVVQCPQIGCALNGEKNGN